MNGSGLTSIFKKYGDTSAIEIGDEGEIFSSIFFEPLINFLTDFLY